MGMGRSYMAGFVGALSEEKHIHSVLWIEAAACHCEVDSFFRVR